MQHGPRPVIDVELDFRLDFLGVDHTVPIRVDAIEYRRACRDRLLNRDHAVIVGIETTQPTEATQAETGAAEMSEVWPHAWPMTKAAVPFSDTGNRSSSARSDQHPSNQYDRFLSHDLNSKRSGLFEPSIFRTGGAQRTRRS